MWTSKTRKVGRHFTRQLVVATPTSLGKELGKEAGSSLVQKSVCYIHIFINSIIFYFFGIDYLDYLYGIVHV